MKENKHIDRLFQETFKDFEVSPDETVWNKISDTLHEKKVRRKVVPIWWKFAGVAAGLLLLITIGNVMYKSSGNTITDTPNKVVDTDSITNSKNNNNNTNVNTNNNSTDKQKVANQSDNVDDAVKPNPSEEVLNGSENNASNHKSLITNSEPENPENSKPLNLQYNVKSTVDNRVANNKKQENILNNVSSEAGYENTSSDALVMQHTTKSTSANTSSKKTNSETLNNERIISPDNPNNTIVNNTDNAINEGLKETKEEKVIEKISPSIEEAIALSEDESEDIIEKEKKVRDRWSVTPNVSPIYFNTLGKGSSIHSQFNNNSKSGNLDVGYGIKAGYAVTERLSIRSGISKINVGYNTNNVFVYQNAGQSQSNNGALRNIDVSPTQIETSIISAETLAFNQAPDVVALSQKSSLNQEISFIEIPLEVAYTVSDKKLNIDVIGGMSTMLLEDNRVYTDFNGNETLLGEANNINDVSYSANFGIGLDYEISKTLSLNLEPTFKYQINTFSDTSGDFQPYIIAVNSGLKFKF